MNPILFTVNGLTLRFFVEPDAPVKWTVAPAGLNNEGPDLLKWARLFELQAAGFNCVDFHGKRYIATSPADLARFVTHRKGKRKDGGWIEIVQEGGGLRVTSRFDFMAGLPAFRTWTRVENVGAEPLVMEYVTSLALAAVDRGGKGRWADKMRLHLADNNWCAECQWRSGDLGSFGLHQAYEKTGHGCVALGVSNLGTWSTGGALPLGVLENVETGWSQFWQIEHNGSWHWEIGDVMEGLYLRAAGPTYREGHWSRRLAKGEAFESVPVTYGMVKGGVEEALRALTGTRRAIRRRNADNAKLPVIFNDYMNCLWGDPTEAKLFPLIEKAARAGCETFVIDAGWYAGLNERWGNTVGEWLPSASRFPNGLGAVMEKIRAHGMSPGLWLEIEVMGTHCPLSTKLPDDWFFLRDGVRLIDNDRQQLDFRNPAVRAHADGIIDRLMDEFQLGYIKMDYNANAAPGTDARADTPGDGMLEHNRAYLGWLEGVFERHPKLTIENCGSGGMRMDYAMLARHSIQSVTDQTDYRFNAVIAAAAASAVTPEQAAMWSYPKAVDDEEETIFNVVNALLLRIHLNGRVLELDERCFGRIEEGVALYKEIRGDIRVGLPFWPLGLPRLGDGWLAFGLDAGAQSYLAVWRLNGKRRQAISLPGWKARKARPKCVYPQKAVECARWNAREGTLEVTLAKPYSARLFRMAITA